jgi:hypothetical protein
LQPACPHVQSMSGVFSMASHCVLQYLPEVVTHEQTGCAHFTAFSGAILFSYHGSRLGDVSCNGSHRAEPILYIIEHIARLPRTSRRVLAATERRSDSPLDSAPPLVYLMQLFGRCFRPREGPCNPTIESFAFHFASSSRLPHPFPEARTRVKPRPQPNPG